MPVEAVQHVRRMRGGAQAHLMRAHDGHFYVVKFQNNPQHLRVLANELLATRLAESVGLPVPVTEIVEVREWLVFNSGRAMFVIQPRDRSLTTCRRACFPK